MTTNNQTVFLSSYLHDDESQLVMERLSKLDTRAARSLKKLTRALLLLWAQGEIELTADVILAITPDRRFKQQPG